MGIRRNHYESTLCCSEMNIARLNQINLLQANQLSDRLPIALTKKKILSFVLSLMKMKFCVFLSSCVSSSNLWLVLNSDINYKIITAFLLLSAFIFILSAWILKYFWSVFYLFERLDSFLLLLLFLCCMCLVKTTIKHKNSTRGSCFKWIQH